MLPDAPRDRELFDAGMRSLQQRYDAGLGLVRIETNVGSWHSPRESLWYALCLLLTEQVSDDAERIIRQVLTMQEQRDGDPHLGNFRWLYEDEVVIDLNAVEFVLEELVHILLRARGKISDATLSEITASMRLAFEEVDRLDVHWTYTNIYLLDVHNSILGGELLDDAVLVERGLRRLREWADHTTSNGAPHEFNSGTYSAVQINALAAIVEHAEHEKAKALALEMEQFMWRHVARHFHPPTMQLAGPHSRAYRRDVVGAPDFLKVLLYKLLGDPKLLQMPSYYEGPGREGNVIVALTEYHCPDDALDLLRHEETREVRESPSRSDGMDTVTYLTPAFALGTMSRPYGVGDPPEVWPGHNSCIVYYRKDGVPGYGVVYCRYLVNDRRVGDFVYESSREALDLWEEGAFRTAQRAGDAIVAYGLVPRGQRPLHRLRLDVRFLGVDEDSKVMVDTERYSGGERIVSEGGVIGVADGDVLIGVRPLAPTRLGHEPPVAVWRDGQETVVSMYNYRGPAKQFWEYRSLTGPFFKGNVRNGFVLRVVENGAYPSLEAFVDALAHEPLVDEIDGAARRISFGDGDQRLGLEYDLRELR